MQNKSTLRMIVLCCAVLVSLSCQYFDELPPAEQTNVALRVEIEKLKETINAPTITPTSTATGTPTPTPTQTPIPTATEPPTPTATSTSSVPECNKVGCRAPGFSLLDLDNQEKSLSDYLGQYVILNFFATWCDPCKREIPAFIKMYEKYTGDALVVLGISVDTSATVKNVPGFVERYGITYPVLLDTDKVVQPPYQIRYIPTTYFLDPEGIIKEIAIGTLSESQLDSKIDSLIP